MNQSKWLLEVEIEGLSVDWTVSLLCARAAHVLGAVRVSGGLLHSGVDDGSRRKRTRVSEQDCGQCVVEVGILVSYLGKTNKRHGRTGWLRIRGGGVVCRQVGRCKDASVQGRRDGEMLLATASAR